MGTDSLFGSDSDSDSDSSSYEKKQEDRQIDSPHLASPGFDDAKDIPPASLAVPPIRGLYLFRELIPLSLQETLLRSILADGIVTRAHPQAMLFPGSRSRSPDSAPSSTLRDLETCPEFLRPLLEVLPGLLEGRLSTEDWETVFDQDLGLQCIVNLYEPGQGISPHVDLPHRYAHPILGVSLAASTVLDFHAVSPQNTPSETVPDCSLLIRPGDVYVLLHEARYAYAHGIAYRGVDRYLSEDGGRIRKLVRGTRVSVTLRRMLPDAGKLEEMA